MQELISEFMSQKRFAVVGATDNPQKYGNQIVKTSEAVAMRFILLTLGLKR